MKLQGLALAMAMVTGCSSSSTVSSGADGGSGADATTDGPKDGAAGNDAAVEAGPAGTCGLTFDWRVRNPPGGSTAAECQAGLDQDCCTQEMACAANADCKQMLQCVNACPSPRTDACLMACERDAGQSEFLAVGDCSKNAAPHLPAACVFP